MRRTASMENATNILPQLNSLPPSSVDSESRDSEQSPCPMKRLEASSSSSSFPNFSSDFSYCLSSASSSPICLTSPNPPPIILSRSEMVVEPPSSSTQSGNEVKLEAISPSSHSLEVKNSASSSSLNPSSVFTYDYNFSNQANGIRLVASAAELGGEKDKSADEYWNATRTTMISSEALIPVQRESERTFFVDGSLESLEESERSNSSLTHPNYSDVLHGHTSQSALSEESSCDYAHRRSFSADVIAVGNEELNEDSIDEKVFSDHKQLSEETLLKQLPFGSEPNFVSPETTEMPRSVDISNGLEESPAVDIINPSATSLPGSPWVDDQTSIPKVFDFSDNRQRNHVDLPAISEESEQEVIPRSLQLIELMQNYNVDSHTYSPTTFSEKDETNLFNNPIAPPPPIHRRVVSDNHILYGANNNDVDDRVEIRPRDHSTRTGTVSSRCKSQVMLHKPDENETGKVDRSLSNSDSALNVEKDENKAPEVPTVPPPVVLTRKNSTAQASSWQRFLPSGGANPHHVIIPTTANLPTRIIKRTDSSVDSSKTDRSRIEKKKEKGSSDTFFGSWLGSRGRAKKSKERPSVDNVFGNYAGRNIPQSASFPVRRLGDSHRPAIPAFTEGLPDNISRVFSPTELHDEAEPERTDLHSLLLENPKWSRLDLFTDIEYQTWHEKYRHDNLNEKAIKKQDAIYELIMIERQHCANLVFLQQGYRTRLLEENILSNAEVNALIPDVIDALLVFHCNLLEQLLERQRSSDQIETISDIIARELSDDGAHTAVCINAYTTFGTAKQKAEQTYSNLKTKNSKFTEFLKYSENDKLYRRYEYKSIMAKIIGRPTKYCLLLETIARNEGNQFNKSAEWTEKAFQAAKRFALRIDQNLMVAQLARHWEKVRTHFDTSSWTYLYIPDKTSEKSIQLRWTLDDICSEINENGRRLMCLGDVWWKVTQSGGTKLNPVTMALFDDILVLLVKKNTSKYAFAMTDQAVLPVSSLILRISGKGQSIMLASAVKPTLLEFEFHTKSDMTKWSSTLDQCINVVPVNVRLSTRNEDMVTVQEHEERKIKEEEETWFKKLNKLFADRFEHEKVLAEYLVSRRKFMDDVRGHVATLNCYGRSDLQDRVREAIKAKFRDLRNSRTVPLNKLIDDITKAREYELMSYLDDFVDIGDGDSDSSNSDSSGKGVRPRRIKTFNGAPAYVNNKEKLQLRRHTTVPRMSESSEASISGIKKTSIDEAVEEQIHQMPLSQPLSSRRGCTRLIKDCEKLKTENINLKNELALERIRVSTLEKCRPASGPSVSAPGETMEALRKKEKEVRELESKSRIEIEEKNQELAHAQTAFELEKRKWEEERERIKTELSRREQEIGDKWLMLKEAESRSTSGRVSLSTPTRIPYEKEPKTPPIQELSPFLKSLTTKSETKRKK